MLDKGQRDDWFGSDFIIWCSVVTVVALVVAIIWELFQEDPVIELHLFKDRNFTLATFTMFMLGVVLYGSTVLLPIFLQTLMGYTAELSEWVLSPGGFLVLLALPVVGRLLTKVEARWLVAVGLTIVAFGMYQMSHFNLDISLGVAMKTWALSRLGLAFLFVPINVTAFYFIPKEKTNNATGLINLARNIGGSVGISFVTTLLARRAQFHQQILVGHLTPLDQGYQSALQGASQALQSAGSNAAQAMSQAHGLIYGNLVRQSNMLAFVDNFWLMAVVCLALIPVMFLMKRAKPHRGPVAVH